MSQLIVRVSVDDFDGEDLLPEYILVNLTPSYHTKLIRRVDKITKDRIKDSALNTLIYEDWNQVAFSDVNYILDSHKDYEIVSDDFAFSKTTIVFPLHNSHVTIKEDVFFYTGFNDDFSMNSSDILIQDLRVL